jgi:hypothetical protein
MRVMVMVKATKESEAGQMPGTELLAAMGQYNEELVKAGVMLAGEGLHPSAKGKRVRFCGATRSVIDGPFAETKELVAGYWLWQVASMDEARAMLGLKGKNEVGFQEQIPRLRAQPRTSQEPGYGFAARYCARLAPWAATRSLAPGTPRFTSRSARFRRSRRT